jgi:hypothetical protein
MLLRITSTILGTPAALARKNLPHSQNLLQGKSLRGKI